MNLLREEKDTNEITMLVPKCSKCDLIMSGFWYKFYKDPKFSQTEVMSAFWWTEIAFQCPKCYGKILLSAQELDKLNSYPMDKVNFPPGFDSKNMKFTRLMSK